ncbi:beta-1,6-N-acetylglucosaminyltransferase [Pedobacter cryoconitis]|uniref:Peptide O-xylosyltransferase n=1 Tax=Pedobacter cryoconitis TaxID=188932 RepID=A0A7X0J4H4_9SPHI|nr:beta-1,6-N-acetylglucosaminyltransferase [Pedobacter cryoconitis]MBB6500968.1 hypothetical protein [Pedobacter cryoconitis]
MKHAYLIIAHHEIEVLKRLIQALDDIRNDIYIHFDQKMKDLPLLSVRYARLIISPERIDVRWADFSQIEVELLLFKQAHTTEVYQYYHLLSGTDMPLQSQEKIHSFFEQHKGKEFIGYTQGNIDLQINRKVQRYHLFPRHFIFQQTFAGLLRRMIRFLFLKVQYLLGIKRNFNISFKKGGNWVSVTQSFVTYLLANVQDIRHIYKCTYCADEIFLHTICWNSPFRQQVFDSENEGYSSQRLIRWKNNRIYDWESSDYHELLTSKYMFARKFNSKHIEIVDRILTIIRNKPYLDIQED